MDSPGTQVAVAGRAGGEEERKELWVGSGLRRGLLCPKRGKETALKEKQKQMFQRTNRVRMLTIQSHRLWGRLALGSLLLSHKGSSGGVGRPPRLWLIQICPYKAICRERGVEKEEEAEVVKEICLKV